MNQEKEKFTLRNWELVSVNPNSRNWTSSDYFNFWAINTQSVIGFSLIASFYLLYDLNSIIVLSGSLIATFLIFIFTNLIGKTSQSSGLPFPVILRLSMGFNGARYIGMLRGLIGIFMFGVQTFFISKSIGYLIRIFLYQIDNQILSNEYLLMFFFGLNPLDWFSLFITLLFQLYLFTKGPETNRIFIKFSAFFVYFGLIIFFIMVISENYNELVNSLLLSTNIENVIAKKNILPLFYITGTMFAYFSILIVSYGDFSRYAKNKKEMQIGNFSLIFNLIFFSFFALVLTIGADIILTKNSISTERLLTNPNDIIAKFNNSVLTVFSLIFILVSMLSTNLIANFVPSQNALINFLPNSLTLNKASYIIIFFGLLIGGFWLSIFKQSSAIFFFDNLTAFFGPIFGVVVADYYFVKEQKINHKELFYPKDNTEYIYSAGWNYKAIYSLIIGFIFSASTIWNPNLTFLESFGWIIGAFVSFSLYALLNND
ncbi:MAG: cytosine permease [Candidatus Pelagibacter sp.]